MKTLFFAGLLLVVLGIASLVVPIPRSETQGIKAGDLKHRRENHSQRTRVADHQRGADRRRDCADHRRRAHPAIEKLRRLPPLVSVYPAAELVCRIEHTSGVWNRTVGGSLRLQIWNSRAGGTTCIVCTDI